MFSTLRRPYSRLDAFFGSAPPGLLNVTTAREYAHTPVRGELTTSRHISSPCCSGPEPTNDSSARSLAPVRRLFAQQADSCPEGKFLPPVERFSAEIARATRRQFAHGRSILLTRSCVVGQDFILPPAFSRLPPRLDSSPPATIKIPCRASFSVTVTKTSPSFGNCTAV
jgi:hypothetical protein